MGKCESCGVENVTTQFIKVGSSKISACGKCYASIERDKAQTDYFKSNTRRY